MDDTNKITDNSTSTPDNTTEKLRRFRNRMKWEFRVGGWLILFVGIFLVFDAVRAVIWVGISLIVFAAIVLVLAETVWKVAGRKV